RAGGHPFTEFGPKSKNPGSDRSAEAFVTHRPWGFFWLFLASAASRKVQLGWKIAGDFESGVNARRERLCPGFHDVSLVIGHPPAGRARLFRIQSHAVIHGAALCARLAL